MEELERAARLPAESGSSENAQQLEDIRSAHGLIEVLAQADQNGYLTFLTAAPVFQSIGIQLVKTVDEKRFSQHRFIHAEQLYTHGFDALGYVIRTAMQQTEYEISMAKQRVKLDNPS